MPASAFAHFRHWVFDLDNTLYPPSAALFDQIEVRMIAYVMRELGVDHDRANHLRASYWAQHGTTLAGLMAHHDVDPVPYLAEVHDISFDDLTPDPVLADRIAALPGRRIVFTNGDVAYAQNVLEARELGATFDAVYGVEETGFIPKPEAPAFEAIFGLDGTDPASAAMFEDDPRNLAVPHALGMQCVLVGQAEPADHIHHQTTDLTDFLTRVAPPPGGAGGGA
ncbi:MAG: pyrimidine 5'-nucleotidase [Rhodobacteraceae bacterium]|nr:pyrimidine 5'-nucleotidase [Paracoccaceae bacterium]